ncbi:hypothetical protein [Rothia sp. CCM 9419]|uniref:hypothetical protein n=1 Tax=Rothia sp. CCM 9419 TaxID=3402662 RepID=UPI003AE48B12
MENVKPHLLDSQFWRWALFGIPVLALVAYFFTWDELANIEATWLKLLIVAGEIAAGYVGLAMLLWWNAFMQHRNKSKR